MIGLGIALSLFYWVVFQQLGGIFTADATDPNLGPLMILLALAAWPRRSSLPEPCGARPDEVMNQTLDTRGRT